MILSVPIMEYSFISSGENKESIENLAAFLKLDMDIHESLDILQNYVIMLWHFDYSICKEFYFLHLNKILKIQNEKITIAEIYIELHDLHEKSDDIFLCCIFVNAFILVNQLSYHIVKDASELIKFNNKLTFETLDEHYRKFESNSRIIELINQGLISPLIFDVSFKSLKFNKLTFTYLVKDQINIPALMVYDLDTSEISTITLLLASNKIFKDECINYIKDQGILNNTMLIIGSLCNFYLKGSNIDYNGLKGLFCSRHIREIFIPFSFFQEVGDLQRLEIYYIYLFYKNNLKDDINNIIEAFSTSEINFQYNIIGTDNTKPSDSFIQTLEFSSPVDLKRYSFAGEMLHLVITKYPNFPFSAAVFKHIPELHNEPYFKSICRKHAKDLIDNSIQIQNCKYMEAMRSIIEFLKKEDDDVSFETIDTSILKSSFEPEIKKDCISNTNVKLELIYFDDNPWIDSKSANLLFDYYIENNCNYDINALAKNFLADISYSKKIIDYFAENYLKIDDKVSQGLVASKCGIFLDVNAYSSIELKQILNRSKHLYSLKHIIMTQKLPKKIVENFFNSLTENQKDELLVNYDCYGASVSFSTILVGFMFRTYAFVRISNLLIRLLEHKNIEIIKEIQRNIIIMLNGRFIDEDSLEWLEKIYERLLKFEEKTIKKNNENLLILIAKTCKSLGKETIIGNIKC